MPIARPFSLLALIFLLSFLTSCETLKRTSSYSTTAALPRSTPTKTPAPRTPVGAYEKHVQKVIEGARNYLGTPYLYGGNDNLGIDCSGLICTVYNSLGYKVPRISWQQAEFGRNIENVEDIRPGDWLFFVPESGKEGYVSHAGIVTEVGGKNNIRFIHASTSQGVREDNLYSTYFKSRFVKALRPF